MKNRLCMAQETAVLILENGSVYRGRAFGNRGEALGEVCFNTSMSGYQEILTDPSYCRQIITMTYPMIGNYGISAAANESDRIQAAGFIVKEAVHHASNHTSEKTLDAFLREGGITGIEGIDTRKLVLELRSQGAMRGGIFGGRDFAPELLDRVRSIPVMTGLDLASEVSTKSRYAFGDTGKKYRVAVVDYGVKRSILELLNTAGFAVEVFPARTTAAEIRAGNFHCTFLSNGPGDPEPLSYAIEMTRELMKDGRPIFGICLGHQIIGLAEGRSTYKLKFGHRGANQPVKNKNTGRVEITSQNHGFAVRDESAGKSEISHVNLNDQTVEGFLDSERFVMSVQYHPEASPGPHDSSYLFNDFFAMVDKFHQGRAA